MKSMQTITRFFFNVVFFLSLVTSVAHAQVMNDILRGLLGPKAEFEITDEDLARVVDALNHRSDHHSLLNAYHWRDSSTREFESCFRQYEDFYKDGVLDLSITFGYHDWPALGTNLDQSTFSLIYNVLTRACTQGEYDGAGVCGFEEVDRVHRSKVVLERRAFHFSNNISYNPRTRVTLTFSSASEVDSKNVTSMGATEIQEQYSRVAEDQFFGSIGEPGHANVSRCDVCTYIGHARNGGGPDFRPVPLSWRKKDGEPNYGNYLKDRTNFRRLMRAIHTSSTKSKQLIAVMGCNSKGNFYDSSRKACLTKGAPGCAAVTLKDYEKKVGLLLTDKLSWPQNGPRYIGILLDGVLNYKCRSAWDDGYNRLGQHKKFPEAYQLLGNFMTK